MCRDSGKFGNKEFHLLSEFTVAHEIVQRNKLSFSLSNDRIRRNQKGEYFEQTKRSVWAIGSAKNDDFFKTMNGNASRMTKHPNSCTYLHITISKSCSFNCSPNNFAHKNGRMTEMCRIRVGQPTRRYRRITFVIPACRPTHIPNVQA